MNYIAPVISLVSGAFGAFLIVKIGAYVGLVDYPDNRSSHVKPVPKGGGIGVLLAFLICVMMLDFGTSFWFPVVFISVMSLIYGDLKDLPPNHRLIIHFLSSGAFLSGIIFYYNPPVVTFISFLPLTVFIVGTANFYNFMDGINGIAAISGIIAFGFIAVWGILFDRSGSLVFLSLSVSFSLIGFLPFNMPDAKVFMGDVGSILLGFLFAGFVIMFSETLLDFLCLSGFLFPFYADELSTMVIRVYQGESLKKPHRKHLYQVMANEMAISHVKIALGYGLFQAATGVSLLFAIRLGAIPVILIFLANFLGFIFISSFFRGKILFQTKSN